MGGFNRLEAVIRDAAVGAWEANFWLGVDGLGRGPEPVVPAVMGGLRGEVCREQCEELLFGPGAWQIEADARCPLDHAGGDLDRSEP